MDMLKKLFPRAFAATEQAKLINALIVYIVIAVVGALVGFLVGTLLGYFAVTVSAALLPFALSFAGGTMIYVISDEMIPETHHGDTRGSTYCLLAGFCLMLAMSYYLG